MDSAKGFQLAESDEDARNALHWKKNDGSSKAPVIWNAIAKASENEERDERKLSERHPSIQLRPLISPHLLSILAFFGLSSNDHSHEPPQNREARGREFDLQLWRVPLHEKPSPFP